MAHRRRKNWKTHLIRAAIGVVRRLVITAFVAAALILILPFIVPRLVDLDRHRPEIISTLEWLTGRHITIQRLSLNLLRGVAVECQNVEIYEDNGKEVFARTDRAYLVVRLLPLLRRQVLVDKIVLKGPNFTLKRDAQGQFNAASMVSTLVTRLRGHTDASSGGGLQYLEGLMVYINDGSGHWVDDKILRRGSEEFKMQHVNFLIPRFSMSEKIPFRLSFEIPRTPTPCFVELKGFVLDLPKDLNPEHIFVDVQMRLRSGDLTFFLPYYRKYLPYRSLQGNYTFKGQYLGALLGEFKLTGSLLVDGVKLNYPAFFKNVINIDRGEMTFAVRRTPKVFEVHRLEARFDDIHLTANGYLDHLDDAEEASVHLDFVSERIPIVSGQRFVPVNAIPKRLPEFEQFFTKDLTGGAATNVEAHLRGRFKDWTMAGFEKNLDLVAFRADVDHITVKVRPDVEPLIFTAGTVTMDRGTLSFLNMHASWAESRLQQGFGTITNLYNDDALLKLWVDADLDWRHAAAVLSYDLFDILPKMDHLKGKGILQGRLNVEVPFHKARAFSIDGTISGRKIAFDSPRKTLRFSDISTTLTFRGQTIRMPPTALFLGSSPVVMEIHFSDYHAPVVEAVVRSTTFNFEDVFPASLVNTFDEEIPEPPQPDPDDFIGRWTVSGYVAADRATFKKFKMSNLYSRIALQHGHLKLPQLRFRAYGGQYEGTTTDIDVHPESRGDFNAGFRYRGFDVAALLDGLQFSRYKITGIGVLSGRASSNCLNHKALAANLEGQARLDIANGSVEGLKAVANAFRLMQLRVFGQNAETFAFQWARGSFSASDGVLSTRDLFMHSNNGSISFVGNLDLPQEQVDGYMGVHAFEGLDKVINAVPVLGTVVGGPDRKLMTTYFSVRGPVDNPSVNSTPLHSLRGGILNFFKKFK